jgi:hypothetical protein
VASLKDSILFTNSLFSQCSGYGQTPFGHYVAIISGNSSDDSYIVAEKYLAISKAL